MGSFIFVCLCLFRLLVFGLGLIVWILVLICLSWACSNAVLWNSCSFYFGLFCLLLICLFVSLVGWDVCYDLFVFCCV